jgi:hypothetical protein
MAVILLVIIRVEREENFHAINTNISNHFLAAGIVSLALYKQVECILTQFLHVFRLDRHSPFTQIDPHHL